MPKFEAKHDILLPTRLIAMGEVVTEFDLESAEEVERLTKLGAIVPLKGTEGYQEPFLRPDQGTDASPRGATASVFATATSEEIDAQIAALKVQSEQLKTQEEAKAKADADAVTVANDKKSKGKPISGTQAINADGTPAVDQNGQPIVNP